ncbi:DUF2683 family protein [Pedobacter sp. Leaf250]|uniref:DUF2683 family protein n=1 Tax=Pedobacter sp. Leaf250 TaxID=2876559 RepID=UPI001E5F27AA|nr:DUF2683 family protein [Pedobacter sp. Leaf250]
MQTIVIHPENSKQLEILKTFMEEQKINFQIKPSDTLPDTVLKSIERGLSQAKNDLTISFDEFKSRHYK